MSAVNRVGIPVAGHVNGSVSGVGGAGRLGRVGGRSTTIGAIVNAMDDERRQRLIDEADLRDLIHRYAFGL